MYRVKQASQRTTAVMQGRIGGVVSHSPCFALYRHSLLSIPCCAVSQHFSRTVAHYSDRSGDHNNNHNNNDNSYLKPQLQQQPTSTSDSAPRFRERPSPTASTTPPTSASALEAATPPTTTRELTGAELKAQQDKEMDRATRRAARQARARRRHQSRVEYHEPAPVHPAPPLYFPQPFASLPVIPSPVETITSALIRVDKVPKSPGFGKEISRVRGQMAKYNFIARRQLEVMSLELADKLHERISAFPRARRNNNQNSSSPKSNEAEGSATVSTEVFDEGGIIHPFDQVLLHCNNEGGVASYTSLLNRCTNLVQKLRGAHRDGLQKLNHSKSLDESKTVHREAILRMKAIWKEGILPSEQNGFAGQESGLKLVEELRNVSKTLRHIPQINFEKNLLNVKRNVAAYLSLLPQEFFLLQEQELTFELLRPYLPPSPDYTFSLLGGPNVGKSSLLAAISAAKVQVAPYAFTSKHLTMGHLEREEQLSPSWIQTVPNSKQAINFHKKAASSASLYPLPKYTPQVPVTKLQLLDTPGLLFRPDLLRKPAELLSIAVAQHVQPLILGFVLDETGQSGMRLTLQKYLRRELLKRFSQYQAPHPLADDKDTRNRVALDPLYANVAASKVLTVLGEELSNIPWIDIRTKIDVKKKQFVADEILERGAAQGEKDVTTIEKEIEAELQREEEAATEAAAAAGSTSKSDELVPTWADGTSWQARPSGPSSVRDRAGWKLDCIRSHMKTYLTDASGKIFLEEEAPILNNGKLLLTGSTQTGSSSSASSWKALPCLSVSSETGKGLKELVEHLWHEVDQRESLRLERDYLEMKARILWMRGDSPQLIQMLAPSASSAIGTTTASLQSHSKAPRIPSSSHYSSGASSQVGMTSN